MRLLLDTASFLWAIRSPELLSRPALAAISDPANVRELSSISISEIAIKQSSGKFDFGRDDLTAGINDLRVHVLPYGEDHAHALYGLPLHHKDPFDRQIIAQALAEKIPVVTPDKIFKLYGGLQTIW